MRSPTGLICALLAIGCLGRLGHTQQAPAAGDAGQGLGSVLSGDYIDERHLTLIRFGEHHSHYLQPWRAYLETIPAHQFLDGIGVCMPAPGRHNADLICRMLAEHGFACGRVEIGWASLSYEDEGRLNGPEKLRELLAAMRVHKIRPLILLNAHQGAPCPLRFFERTVLRNAAAGDRTLALNKTDDLRIGYSGPCDLTKYWAAEALVTGIDGDTVTLSKPLPKPLEAGAKMRWAALKYRPFGKPDTEDYAQTVAGWQRYARTVATFVADALGTAGSDDLGFDMEVWNELTFGTEFLYINHYYEPALVEYNEREIWDRLVEATAEEMEADPATYAGAALVNGFANTIPWPASSLQPARVSGICKHPYAGVKHYPQDEQKSKPLGADGQPTDFVPTYTAHFPEYYACALQTETMCRDTSPLNTDIYRTLHGRLGRRPEGGQPVWVWITEVNFDPAQRGIEDPAEAMRLKAKAAARYFCFFLNKGVEKLFLYNATGHEGNGELDLATMAGAFNDYTRENDAWPADIAPYVSPQLRVMKRITDLMREGLDRGLAEARSVGVASIADTHGHYQFEGNGTAEGPPLYNRELLAVLPYQVNDSSFVIAYYVMTRDVVEDMPPEEYTITLAGLKGQGAELRAYDPIGDRDLPVELRAATEDTLSVEVPATDYPCLLAIRER